jgi:uncharacterized membrane protein
MGKFFPLQLIYVVSLCIIIPGMMSSDKKRKQNDPYHNQMNLEILLILFIVFVPLDLYNFFIIFLLNYCFLLQEMGVCFVLLWAKWNGL